MVPHLWLHCVISHRCLDVRCNSSSSTDMPNCRLAHVTTAARKRTPTSRTERRTSTTHTTSHVSAQPWAGRKRGSMDNPQPSSRPQQLMFSSVAYYSGPCDNCGRDTYTYSGGAEAGRTFHQATRSAACNDLHRSQGVAVVNGWRCGNCKKSYLTESERDECEYHHASS